MFRSSLLFWTGVVALGFVALCCASTASSKPPIDRAASICKIRPAVRRRRTRKEPLRRARAYLHTVAVPHMQRHAPCAERS